MFFTIDSCLHVSGAFPSRSPCMTSGFCDVRAYSTVYLLLFFVWLASYQTVQAVTQSGDSCRNEDEDADRNVCVTEGCVRAAASVLANMDKSVRPCDDFYGFACGKYVRETRVDDDKTSRSTYSAVEEVLAGKVRGLLEMNYRRSGIVGREPRHVALAKRLYAVCMNERKLDDEGVGPVLDLIASVGGWPVLQGDDWLGTGFRWLDLMYRCRELGLPASYLIDLSVKVNHMNTSQYIMELNRATLGFNPLYLKSGIGDPKVYNYYRYMVDVAVALGAQKSRAESELLESLKFEVQLSKIMEVNTFVGI